MRQRCEVAWRTIERPRLTRAGGRHVHQIYRGHEGISKHDVVAAGGSQSGGPPCLLDFPTTRREAHESRSRCTIRWFLKRLSVSGQHANRGDPIGVPAPARKWPSAVYPPTIGLFFGRAAWLA